MNRARSVLLVLVVLPNAVSVSPALGGTTQAQQTGSPTAPQPSSQAAISQPVPNTDKPDKKVWTNEDVGDLRDHSAISTVGKSGTKVANSGGQPAPVSKGKDAGWYRNQIEKLQAKIPPLDGKIHQLQAALNGEIVDSARPLWGVRPDDWRDQLARLQKQREGIVAKIAALQDEARHNGVPPNALP